jgi:LPXTG-motif cell wall-anchored protein
VVPSTTETFVTPQYQSITGAPSTGDSGIISTVLMALVLTTIGIVLLKKLRGRKRTPRSRWSTTPSLSDDLPVEGWREVREFENRFQSMRDEDPDQILVDAGATLKNFSKKGNELYETRRIIRNRVLKILKYVDPSTGRIYISFVPDHINDADEAMAWKFSITKQQYRDLVDQG